MAQTPGVTELIDWLAETIEPLQGEKWQIMLNSDGAWVEATAKIVTSERQGRGQSMTISKVSKAKFRIGHRQRIVFSTD